MRRVGTGGAHTHARAPGAGGGGRREREGGDEGPGGEPARRPSRDADEKGPSPEKEIQQEVLGHLDEKHLLVGFDSPLRKIHPEMQKQVKNHREQPFNRRLFAKIRKNKVDQWAFRYVYPDGILSVNLRKWAHKFSVKPLS